MHYNLEIKKENRAIYIALIVCFCVFITAIFILIYSFNSLMNRHDRKLSGEICNLVSEKVSESIAATTDSLLGISKVLEAQNFSSPEEIYDVVKANERYVSMGFIGADKAIYGTANEKEEFAKWDLLQTAELADPVSMSMPYRSAISGQPVITMFAKVKYGNTKQGWVFATVLFKNVQDMASTSVFLDAIDVWLMDSETANMIQCNSRDEKVDGRWSNAYLIMSGLDEKGKKEYSQWLEKVKNGDVDLSLNYEIEDEHYSAYAAEISSMPGWFVLVRLPSSVLSDTVNSFKEYVLNFILVLLIIVVFIIVVIYRMNIREKERLEEISIHDPLTSLFNRRAFDSLAKKWIEKQEHAALIFIDVDHFKQINDGLGHEAGDILLEEFSNILQSNLGEKSMLFRLGGDEFVALIEMDSMEELDHRMENAKIEINKIELPNFKSEECSSVTEIGFSAGIAVYPDDTGDLGTLMRCADTALYVAKERGRNGYCWYNSL